ncbi:hypothetical protein Nepgr_018235 [Nepenthes gracilis]|uniref:Uncharacterized protein n=1 Tax=Nepenthes gracilis TaxID=150966 RepID=A0AAD3XTU6_NEPGR|nr:hypothetical protein Nepgr_018235 [Nepenthes gracilis]
MKAVRITNPINTGVQSSINRGCIETVECPNPQKLHRKYLCFVGLSCCNKEFETQCQNGISVANDGVPPLSTNNLATRCCRNHSQLTSAGHFPAPPFSATSAVCHFFHTILPSMLVLPLLC